jgi:hypothetical protein
MELTRFVVNKNIATERLAMLGSTTVFKIKRAGDVHPFANKY